MLRLIAYDISNPRTLRRIAKVCLDFGIRLEKSVFECDLTEDDFAELWKRLCETAHEATDSLVAYPVCAACERRRQEYGRIDRRATAEVVIV